jgi:hypothetical protein
VGKAVTDDEGEEEGAGEGEIVSGDVGDGRSEAVRDG